MTLPEIELLYTYQHGASRQAKETTMNTATATVTETATVTLPRGRYEHCSRGRDWCGVYSDGKSKGSYDDFVDASDEGFVVDKPGRYVVGSTDGFRRKSKDVYDVIRSADGSLSIKE